MKLLQSFDDFTLRPDAQPEGTTVPAHWAHAQVVERQSKEKIFPRTYLTMSAHVSDPIYNVHVGNILTPTFSQGRNVDLYEGSSTRGRCLSTSSVVVYSVICDPDSPFFQFAS